MAAKADADAALRRQILEQIAKKNSGLVIRPYDDVVFYTCNGYAPKTFAEAEIEFDRREQGTGIRLLTLYNPGLKKLLEYCAGKYTSTAMQVLVDFLKDSNEDVKAVSKVFSASPTEAEITVVLAVHLFAKLTPSTVFVSKTLSSVKGLSGKCPCKCGASFQTGNTGLGLPKVWHGFADIVLDRVPVTVCVLDEGEDSEGYAKDDENLPPTEKKLRTTEDDKTTCVTVKCQKTSERVIRQILAQTITNSFSQTAEVDKLRKKFVPSILCSRQGVQMFAYNVEHDFLIHANTVMGYFETDRQGKQLQEFCLPTILEIWLALNVHFTGCDADSLVPDQDEDGTGLAKCGFKKIVQEKNVLQDYENAGLKISSFPSKVPTSFYEQPRFGVWYVDTSFNTTLDTTSLALQ